jgi:hypothetical protein
MLSLFYVTPRSFPWTGRTTACTERSEVMNENRSPDIPVRAFIGQGCPIYEGDSARNDNTRPNL